MPMLGWLSRISLILTLALAGLFELVLNRIGVQLASPAARAESHIFPVIDTVGLFAFYFTGVLAAIVFCWGLVVMIADTRLFRPWARLALMLGGAAFLPLAVTGMFLPLPPALSPWLNLGFVAVVLLLTAAFLTCHAASRHRFGVLYLVLPLLAHAYWLATKQLPALAPEGTYADLPARVLEIGQQLVVVGAFASFLFFAPLPRLSVLRSPIPVLVAVFFTAALAAHIGWHYPTAAKAAYWGLGLHLPSPSAGELLQLLLYLGGLFLFLLVVVALFFGAPAERGLSLGLVLLAISGYHLELPYQLLLTATGLMQIIRAILVQARVEVRTPSPSAAYEPVAGAPDWRAFFSRALEEQGVEAIEPVLLQSDRGRVVRVKGQIEGQRLTLRCQIHKRSIVELELELGVVPKDGPGASLSRQRPLRGRRLRRVRGLAPSPFDSGFVLREGETRLGEALSALLPQLRETVHGRLDLWPGEGLRYTARPLADGWPVPLAALASALETAPTADLGALVRALLALGASIELD